MSNTVSIALSQCRASTDPAENLSRAKRDIELAAGKGARLVCLQELFATPYFCQGHDESAFDLAESIPGPTTQALAASAKQFGIAVIAPVFERRAAGLYYNSAVVIDASGDIVGKYRKLHIPDDPQFEEKYYFTPGDLGVPVVDLGFAKVCVLICWDQWFPEVARLAALKGAEIVFYPTAIGWLPDEKASAGAGQLDAWRTVQRSHGITNGMFVAAVNRVGTERSGTRPGDSIEFWGNSFVSDPCGRVVAQAGEEAELLLATCDLAQIESTRRAWPFLRDRRVDIYSSLAARYLRD